MSVSLRSMVGANAGAERLDAAVWRLLFLFVGVYLTVKIGLLFVLGVNTQFLMDEYAIASDALLVDQNPYREVWPHKTLLSAYLYRLAFWLGDGTVEVLRFARIEALAVAVASLGLLFALARAMGRSRLGALLVVCVALGFSTYMERAFIVRPEPLALLFALAALLAAIRAPERLSACLLAGALSGVAFLATQKAVYFNVALGVALIGDGLLRRSAGRALTAGFLLVLGWAAMVAAYAGFFAGQGADFMVVLERVFLGPPTENVTRGHEVYENLRLFVGQTFARNVPQYSLCLAGLALGLVSIRRRTPSERIALIFTAAIAVLIYGVHPAPWPYNFVLAIPFLALWIPLVFEPLRRSRGPVKALSLALVLVILSLSIPRNVAYLEHANGYQNRTAALAEALLAPGERYFDGVFMVATRPHATDLWLQRSHLLDIREAAGGGDFSTIERILAAAPKVWIVNYRIQSIEHALKPYLERSYLPVAPNILLAGVALEGGAEHIFENRWGGDFRLYTAAGRPSAAKFLLDGRPAAGATAVAPGRHRLRLAGGGGPLYLLPANIGVPLGRLPNTEFRELFPDAHGFGA